jgi:hypothetical protein
MWRVVSQCKFMHCSVRHLGSSSIPGLYGQCCVHVWWTTPVQSLNLRLWLFGFARSVLHSSCTDIHFWYTRLTGAIVITGVQSAILKLCTNFWHAPFPLYC